MIKVFRIKSVLKWSIGLTGLIFLNMNFFLAEVSVLELDKKKDMAENIAKLIANAATEEEKDIFGGPEAKDLIETELLCVEVQGKFYLLPFQLAFKTHDGAKPITGNSETVNPPPEVSRLS